MTYFNSRDIAIIALCAALWGVLNSTLSPIFFQIFQLPFLCDIIGFASLIIALWWTRKFGTATAVGAIATIVNFIFRPDALFFLGFTVASFVFDVLARLLGYKNCFEKTLTGPAVLVLISVFSAAVAGTIIGLFFTAAPLLAKWGVAGWAGLHAVGGVIGGFIEAPITTALSMRGIKPATA
ncbi:MAG: hypothetical protein ACQXXH_00825 [Candidatus Bathyarchaeia archaeon]|jgi:hypothetical protein|nr:hypothetical protein [Candidatus Bathyarchaeota archaeon A05DMB-4]MDH7595390.1 hypothetical protein [Candidatus Bathyarchaeota archaeon]